MTEQSSFQLLLIGSVMGLSAGFAPGPLLMLVLSETLRHGVGSGIKVAMSPIITDLPIILATLYLLSHLAELQPILGSISLVGGCFLAWMGYENIKRPVPQANAAAPPINSLGKGVLTNMLSPHPYLFWLTVGAPIISRANNQSLAMALSFLVGFYGCLLGSKIGLAVLAGQSQNLLSSTAYQWVIRCLGGLLFFLAFILFRDGVGLLLAN